MNRFLFGTAVGLLLGLPPALAETQSLPGDAQTPPAVNQPSQIPEVMPSTPSMSTDPASPIPGDTSQMSPEPAQPGAAQPGAEPPAQSGQAEPQPSA